MRVLTTVPALLLLLVPAGTGAAPPKRFTIEQLMAGDSFGGVSFSPDGKTIVTTSNRTGIANIYARDEYKCQYCARVFPTQELTFDHVVPVSQGGRKDWENIVTCCVTCNRRKGGRTPHEAGMTLIRSPRRPNAAPAIRITIGLRQAPESWRDYLYWNLELDDT